MSEIHGAPLNTQEVLKAGRAVLLSELRPGLMATQRVLAETNRPIRVEAAIAPLFILANLAELGSGCSGAVTEAIRRWKGSATMPSKRCPKQKTAAYLRALADAWLSNGEFTPQPLAMNWMRIVDEVLCKLGMRRVAVSPGLAAPLDLLLRIGDSGRSSTREGASNANVDDHSFRSGDLTMRVRVANNFYSEISIPTAGIQQAMNIEWFKDFCAQVLLGRPTSRSIVAMAAQSPVHFVPPDLHQGTTEGSVRIGNFTLKLDAERYVALKQMLSSILINEKLAGRFTGKDTWFLY